MNSRTLSIAAIVVVGSAGFLVGRFSQSRTGGDAGSANGGGDRTWADGKGADRAGAGAGDARRSSRDRSGDRKASAPVAGEEGLARLESIVRGGDALARSRAMLEYIGHLNPGDFEAAVTRFRSLGMNGSRLSEYGMLLTAWTQVDPLKALEYVRTNTNGRFALATVLSAWANKDAEGAIAWAEANHKGDGPNPFMSGIIGSIATSNIPRASELLNAMPRSRERGEALDGFIDQLWQSGVGAVRQWAAAQTDESLKNGAITRLAGRLAEVDPAGTAEWLLSNPGEAANDSFSDVMAAWSGKDFSTATVFFEKLPAGDIRSNAFRGMVSAVTSKNPAEGAALIDRYPNDATGGALRNFVWHSMGQDPALALAYVSRMPDVREQERTYRRALQFWLDRDPSGANAWLSTNPVPQSVSASLRRPQGSQ